MMETSHKPAGTDSLSRVFLWSIWYQDRLARYIRLYLFGIAVSILLMCAGRIISFDAALNITFIGGLTFWIGLCLFIVKRRSWLLSIRDPGLKREAHVAMLAYIAAKEMQSGQKQAISGDKCRSNDCPF